MKKLLITAAAVTGLSGPIVAQETVSIARFFGSCEDAGTDFANAVGEACIIQSLINAYSATDNGVTMETREVEWGSLYDQMKAGYAAGTPPHIHVMHKSRLPEFADIGLLADMSDDLAGAGIDTADWEPRALDGVSHNGAVYAVPMDFHANLWHMNMELMAEAGLVENGEPVLPSSPDELVAHAKQFMDATGKSYLAADFARDSLGSHLILALAYQQGAELITDGEAGFRGPEMTAAIQTVLDLMDTGAVNPQNDYPSAEQDFLNGEAGILVNGTWVVDAYTASAANPETALADYRVTNQPTLFGEPATWGDSHSWVVPASLKETDPEGYAAALGFLAFLNENNEAWAKTGHMAVRTSVLESDNYNALPQRENYAATSGLVNDLPRSTIAWSIRDVVVSGIQSTYLADVPIADALAEIDAGVQELLDEL